MASNLQPLSQNFAIVDANGFPTQYFIKWAQQRQIDITNGITAAQAQQLIDDWAAVREIIAGVGLSGGGVLSADVTLQLNAVLGNLNDVDVLTTPPINGDTLIYDAGDMMWKPGAVAGGGGGKSLLAILAPVNTNSVGWANYTIRQRVISTAFAKGGFSKLRLAYRASGTEGLTVDKVYIGVESGTPYEFSTTPTAVTFNGGSAGFAIATNASAVSDEILLAVPDGSNVVITLFVPASAGSTDGFRAGVETINGDYIYKAGDDATTLTPVGYSASVTAKSMIAMFTYGS